jgi:Lipid A 3-O-deacylase (PagL)
MKTLIIIYLFLLLFAFHSFGQPNFDNWQVKTKYHYGAVLALHESVNYLIKDNSRILEINFAKQLIDDRNFVSAYNYPVIGFGLNNNSLGNNTVFGNATSVYSFYNFPLKRTAFFEANTQIAAGIAYVNKIYDVKENYMNNVIGSHFNAYINFSAETEFKIQERLSLLAGISYHHYSNGKISLPNLGLNTLNYFLGLSYNLYSEDEFNREIVTNEEIRKHEIITAISAGIMAVDVSLDKKYFASTIATDYYYRLNQKYKLGFGANVFYNAADEKKVLVLSENSSVKEQKLNSGLHHSQSLIIGSTSMYVQIGFYLFADKFLKNRLYDRLGIQYEFENRILLNLSIKAHYFKADYIEWGIGYVW